MNIEYILPLVCFWHTISAEIAKYKSPNMTNNIISFIHCLSYIAHYHYDYNLNYAIHISIGFYIYDLLYIFSQSYREKSKLKRHAPFIIHHLVGIGVLNLMQNGESKEHILCAYDIIEKSNIMLYISYYVRKQYAGYYKLNAITEFLQLLAYSYFRLFELSLYIYNYSTQFFQFRYTTQVMIIGIYSMGVAWSYRLLQKNIANYNSLVVRSRSRSRSDTYLSAG